MENTHKTKTTKAFDRARNSPFDRRKWKRFLNRSYKSGSMQYLGPVHQHWTLDNMLRVFDENKQRKFQYPYDEGI